MMDVSKYMGVPFKENGRDIETGLDCYGLLLHIYRDMGIALLDKTDYTLDDKEDVHNLIEKNKYEWKQVDRKQVCAGTVVYFRILGVPMHLGIMINYNQFVHSICKTGVCIENLNSIVWNRRVVGFYEYAK